MLVSQLLEKLRNYIMFDTRLVETSVVADTIIKCIERDEYPRLKRKLEKFAKNKSNNHERN